jgi:hypothetical protein
MYGYAVEARAQAAPLPLGRIGACFIKNASHNSSGIHMKPASNFALVAAL